MKKLPKPKRKPDRLPVPSWLSGENSLLNFGGVPFLLGGRTTQTSPTPQRIIDWLWQSSCAGGNGCGPMNSAAVFGRISCQSVFRHQPPFYGGLSTKNAMGPCAERTQGDGQRWPSRFRSLRIKAQCDDPTDTCFAEWTRCPGFFPGDSSQGSGKFHQSRCLARTYGLFPPFFWGA